MKDFIAIYQYSNNNSPALKVCLLHALQDHEQALIDAIAKLAYASDGESGNNKYAWKKISCIFLVHCEFSSLGL